jgi:hypothetical protein
MITSIRNIDPKALQRLRVEAKRKGITMGDALTQAIEQYLTQTPKKFDVNKLPLLDFGPGNENLSQEIDEILYGKATR